MSAFNSFCYFEIRSVIVMIFLAGQVSSAGAQFNLSANAVYGSYKMADMKDFQRAVVSSSFARPAITSQFSSDFSVDISAKMIVKERLLMGACLGIGTARGRLSANNNALATASDQTLGFATFSMHLGVVEYFSGGNVMMMFDLQPGLVVSALDVKYYNPNATTDESTYSSVGLKAQPTVSIVRRWKKFGVSCFGGYYLNFINSAFQTEDQSDYLTNPASNKSVRPDWSGFRAGAGLIYFFRSHRSS